MLALLATEPKLARVVLAEEYPVERIDAKNDVYLHGQTHPFGRIITDENLLRGARFTGVVFVGPDTSARLVDAAFINSTRSLAGEQRARAVKARGGV